MGVQGGHLGSADYSELAPPRSRRAASPVRAHENSRQRLPREERGPCSGVRRTFADVDRIEKELKKAARAVDAAAGLTTKYRIRLQALCENSHSPQTPLRSKEE